MKNFGLNGVGSKVQLGKGGSYFQFSGSGDDRVLQILDNVDGTTVRASFRIPALIDANETEEDILVRSEINSLIDATLKAPEAYDPSITGNYPLTYGGEAIISGDSFRITANQIGIGDGNRDVGIEDLLIAIVNGPSATSNTDWMVAEANRGQATETAMGVAELATQAEVDGGINNTNIITPLRLATYISNENIDKTAGAGLTETAGTFDVVASDLSLNVSANDMQVNIGTTNGTSLEVSASGLELRATIAGDRTFNNDIDIQGQLTLNNGVNSIQMPTARGTNGQVMVTDASGNVSWTTPASGPVNVHHSGKFSVTTTGNHDSNINIPLNAIVTKVTVNVTTPGAGAFIEVDRGSTTLMDTNMNDAETGGVYVVDISEVITTAGNFFVEVTDAACAATVIVEWTE